MKVKRFYVLALLACTTIFANAQTTYQTSHDRPFAPISDIAENFRKNPCNSFEPSFACNGNGDCEIFKIYIKNDVASCDSGYAITLGLDDPNPKPTKLLNYQDKKWTSLSQIEAYYQALMYLPVSSKSQMDSDASKKALETLNAQVKKFTEDKIAKLQDLLRKNNGVIWDNYNKDDVFGLYQVQRKMIDLRVDALNFMLKDEKSFNDYKKSYKKFFNENGLELPTLKIDEVSGKTLSKYECEFLGYTENLAQLKKEHNLSCSTK